MSGVGAFEVWRTRTLRLRLVLEGPAAAEQLVDGDCQGVLIDAAVERLAHDQLRGHVLGRAQHHAGAGHRGLRGRRVRGRRDDLGDAEVAQERVPEPVEEDIARLDVAVDITLAVDVVERLGDRDEPAGDVLGSDGKG